MEAGNAALRVDRPVYPRRAEHNTVAEGEGIEVDRDCVSERVPIALAVALSRKAADQGYAPAQEVLGGIGLRGVRRPVRPIARPRSSACWTSCAISPSEKPPQDRC